MRWLRVLIAPAMVLAFLAGSPSPASADIAPGCRSVVRSDKDNKIVIEIVCSDAEDKGEAYSSNSRVCRWAGDVVPCKSEQGTWYSPEQCYISAVSPLPPFTDPTWNGHTDGTLWYCRIGARMNGTPYVIWLPDATPPPDPEQLARRAVEQMQLQPITIGITPHDDPDSVGLVGLPIWLWAENPGDQTIGPISRSVSEGGFTVTATAEVERVRWSMGDGGTETCTGPGTPYKLKYGIAESPTCGHRFETQGEFTVTARSDWIVNWSGIGETGTFRLTLSESTQIVIGELNVLTVSEGS